MLGPIIDNFRHRPEVDGLRALAVSAVVLFHARLGFPGGYVGVDVFFVISGYLITTLILRDFDRDRFSLVDFWERRARRIMPAAMVMVIAVLAAGWLLLLPAEYLLLARSAIAQLFFSGNLFFWRHTDYFSGAAEEMPLLHTWSLAVEEQFYLVVPLAMMLLFRWRIFRQREVILGTIAASLLASLAVSIYAVPQFPGAAFYLLPTRAWELLCGSFVAALPNRTHHHQRVHNLLAWLGLAAIIIPFFTYTDHTPFPGLAALPVCLGTAIFIWSADSRVSHRCFAHASTVSEQHPAAVQLSWWQSSTSATDLLCVRPVVFIGLISYSLYLWHWPVLAFMACWTIEPFSLITRITLVVMSVLIAVLSWRFVETPFRQRRLAATRASVFVYSFSAITIVLMFAFMIMHQSGKPERFSPQILAFDHVKTEASVASRLAPPTTLDNAIQGRLATVGDHSNGAPQILIWGDSHAGAILPAIDTLAKGNRTAAWSAWFSMTPPVLDYQSDHEHSLGTQAPIWNQAIYDFIINKKIAKVLLVGRWSEHLGPHGNAPFERAFEKTVTRLTHSGCQVWILEEVPAHLVSVPKATIVSQLRGIDLRDVTCDRAIREKQTAAMDRLKPRLAIAGAQFIDVAESFYDADQQLYRMLKDTQLLYYDEHHLTLFGARSVSQRFAPLFNSQGFEDSGFEDSGFEDSGIESSDPGERLIRQSEPESILQSIITSAP